MTDLQIIIHEIHRLQQAHFISKQFNMKYTFRYYLPRYLKTPLMF